VRTGLLLLRATGMRISELLDLELDCLLDFAGHGTWLQVPVGKLNSERTVPLDPDTVQVIDAWIAQRGRQRALSHPATAGCSTRLTFWIILWGFVIGIAAAPRRLRWPAGLQRSVFRLCLQPLSRFSSRIAFSATVIRAS
jgi:Phage integrase family